MPPKQQQQQQQQAQRRTRKQILEEDLAQLIRSDEDDDEKVYPVLREALKEGLDVNSKIEENYLFCYFAGNAMIRCFEECFLVGADPVPENEHDVLLQAVTGQGTESQILRILIALSNHKKFDKLRHREAFELACRYSLVEVVEALIRLCGVLVSPLFYFAIVHGSPKLLDIAIENGADVNQMFVKGLYQTMRIDEEEMPLQLAAKKGNGEVVDRLLKAGAKMGDDSAECPLRLAIQHGNISTFEVLFKASKDTVPSSRLLEQAVLYRRIDILQLILAQNKAFVPSGFDDKFVEQSITSNDIELFKILLPYSDATGRHLKVLVRQNKYEMLDAVLFEPSNTLFPKELSVMLEEAPNDEFKKVIQKKIDIMNGVKDEALKEEPQ